MADLKGEIVDANTSPKSMKMKGRARLDYEGVNDVGAAKVIFSPSRFSGEQAFESADSDSKHGSTLASENNSKCHEADMQSSSLGVVKSEISTEMHSDTKKTQRSHLTAAEEGLSTTMRDSQHRTESSCSNTLPVVVPLYQETSKEGYLVRNCGSSMDSSNSKTFDRSPDEAVAASSESGASARIASNARRNVSARNNMIFTLGGNHSSSMITKGERETSHTWDLEAATPEDGEVLKNSDDVKCASQRTSSTKEQDHSTFGKVSVCSDNSDDLYCTRRDGNLPISRSGERIIKHEVSELKRKTIELGSSEVMDNRKGGFRVNESADSSMTKCSSKTMKDEDKVSAGFDLNEDFNANELDDCVQPVLASVSSYSVIHVIAKTGVASGRPTIPLKFEGSLGWKGTAETSAFRPTSVSKNLNGETCSTNHMPKEHEGFAGIDLNVAAVEEREGASSPLTLHEVDQKQAKSPWIDLNSLYDAAEESTQPSNRLKPENTPLIVDLNLDTSSSHAERSNNALWLGQASKYPGNKIPDFPNQRTRDFSFPPNVYLADLSTIHRMSNNAQTLMATPHTMQRMELLPRVALHTLPPQSYYTKDLLPSRYYHEHGFSPAAVNPGFYGAPHPAQFVHEQSSSYITPFVPKFEAKTEHLFSAGGSKNDGPRQFPFLSKESPLGEYTQREAWYAASLKRKEPEGGLDCFQLGYK